MDTWWNKKEYLAKVDLEVLKAENKELYQKLSNLMDSHDKIVTKLLDLVEETKKLNEETFKEKDTTIKCLRTYVDELEKNINDLQIKLVSKG